MKIETTGWIIINIGHPRSGKKFIVDYTFSRLRKDAIKKFIHDSGEGWAYWKKEYNFRVARSTQSISVSQSEFINEISKTEK